MIRKSKSAIRGAGLLTLAVIFFINPNIRMVDILPDFISCFIISRVLSYHADRAPFFSEARSNFIKLGIVSLFRIPAWYFVTTVRAGNVSDYDIIVLFTFVFSLIEAALFYFAIRDLFSALFYLGERSDAAALINPFKISKKGNRTFTPEKLRPIAIIAFAVKACGNALPEMLLLTKSVTTGAHIKVINWYALYPYAIILAVILVMWTGAVCAKRFCAYIRAIKSEGLFVAAADSLIDAERTEELRTRLTIKRYKGGLNYLLIASLFTFVLRFDNLKQINLIPYFMMGVMMIICYLTLNDKAKPYITLSCALFTLTALALQIVEASFLDNYGYEALYSGNAARASYIPVLICSLLCCISAIAFLSGMRMMLGKFAIEKAMPAHGDPVTEGEVRNKLNLWLVSGIIMAVCRCLETVFSYYPDLIIIAMDDGFSNITTGLVPWFGVVLLVTELLFVAACVNAVSRIKDDLSLNA